MWSNHETNDCYDLNPSARPNSGQATSSRVRFLQVPVQVDEKEEFDMAEAKEYLESYHDLLADESEDQVEYS